MLERKAFVESQIRMDKQAARVLSDCVRVTEVNKRPPELVGWALWRLRGVMDGRTRLYESWCRMIHLCEGVSFEELGCLHGADCMGRKQ